ncbi:MAG: FliH/SctL family protein [Rhodospirillales bacterium]
MSPARQFLFDSDFSDPDAKAAEEAAVEEEEPEIEEPEVDLFTEEDMQAARSAAFEQGRRQAETDFFASMESEVLSLVRDIAANLTQICAIQERENAKLTGEAVSVAHAICRKVVPALFEKNSVEEVAHQVHEAVQDLSAAPRILLTVAPALRGPLAERIEHIVAGSGYDGRIEVLEDETLEHGDCLMAWGDGGAERRLADIWRQIDAIVADGAEKVIKSAERGYLRVTGPEAGAEAGLESGPDSPHAAAPPAPPTPAPPPAPAPEPAPKPAPMAVQPEPPAEPQPLETVEESADFAAPPEAAAEAMETAAEASIPAQTSEDEEIEAILSEIDSAAPGAGDDSAAFGAGDNGAASGAGDNMAGETADTVSGAETAPFAEAPPLQSFDDDDAPPEAPSPPPQQPEPAAAPRPAPRPAVRPAAHMENLGIELDTSEPGGDVDNALDKALSVLSGARKPDAPTQGAITGAMPGAMPRRADTTEEDEDESVFGEIVDDALDIALGALSQKKKGPGGRS